MRYRFIDEVVALHTEAPATIEVRKTFAVGDDALSGPLGPHRVPNSLLLELLAMTGGHLVFQCLERRRLPLLLKVQECAFEGQVPAGVALRSRAALNGLDRAAEPTVVAETSGEVLADGARVAAARLLFVCVSVPDADLAAFGALR